MPTTKSQIKAVRAHETRLKQSGGSRINLSLSPAATHRLDELAATHGSRTRAIEWLLAQPAQN